MWITTCDILTQQVRLENLSHVAPWICPLVLRVKGWQRAMKQWSSSLRGLENKCGPFKTWPVPTPSSDCSLELYHACSDPPQPFWQTATCGMPGPSHKARRLAWRYGKGASQLCKVRFALNLSLIILQIKDIAFTAIPLGMLANH